MVEQRDCLVSELLIDPENPRLPEDQQLASQFDLLRYMVAHYDLEELGWSMTIRGYFSEEPLLVVAAQDRLGHFVVVEGNRRLAALKLLTDETARTAVQGGAFWEELASLAIEEGHDLSQVPVRVYPDRKDLLEYLGFRHVSGLMPWEAEAKARFVYRLIVENGYDFQRAAQTIGSRQDAIRRQFVAWSALEQARRAGIDVTPAIQRFGVFYRALQVPGTREFLGLEGWLDATPASRDPLGVDGPRKLEEYLGFIFGGRRVIKESRQLDDLGKVITDPVALAVLTQERDIAVALRELPEDRNAILGSLRTAYRTLTVVNGQVYEFVGDEDMTNEAERIERVIGLVLQTLRSDVRREIS
jgi:hypothetical protein